MFNCVPTVEAICMLVTIHLRSASQQCLVVALTTLPTIESHMVPYKYTRKTFQQFPCTLAGDSLKWNILVVTWALVICLKYTHSHSGCALVLVCIFQANHSCPCYNYYIKPVVRVITLITILPVDSMSFIFPLAYIKLLFIGS